MPHGICVKCQYVVLRGSRYGGREHQYYCTNADIGGISFVTGLVGEVTCQSLREADCCSGFKVQKE